MDLIEAETTAKRLIEQYLPGEGWKFKFNNRKNAFGVCYHDRKAIMLSAPLTKVNAPDHVTATLLHEIAHAMVGQQHGHDHVWKRQARALGVEAKHSKAGNTVPGHWLGTCPGGHMITMHRAPKRIGSCPKCSPVYSAAFLFSWVDTRTTVR